MIIKYYIKINGIFCEHCRDSITSAILKIPHVLETKINGNIATVTCDENIDENLFVSLILKLGYITKNEYISKNKNIWKIKQITYFWLLFSLVFLLNFVIKKILGINIFSMIPEIDNSLSLFSIFLVGIFTSVHCIGMCGSINLVASSSKINSLLYNVGRISCYTIVGGIVGLLGKTISINNNLLGIFTVVISVIMILLGLSMTGIFSIPKKCNNIFQKVNVKNPILLGFLNGFIPCGPLTAMQLYALSTANPFMGALSMFLFGLGTAPLMLGFGLLQNLFNKRKDTIQKVMSIFIIMLSFSMLSRGLSILGINFNERNQDLSKYVVAQETDSGKEQIVEINLDYNNYDDIAVKKDIPVKLIINVEKNHLTGCNNEIKCPDFDIDIKLQEGENIIEFTPTKEGIYTYTCWMNMIKNKIYVYN